jgi:hypothetical protein
LTDVRLVVLPVWCIDDIEESHSLTGSTKHHFRHRATLSIVQCADSPEHSDVFASCSRQLAP